MGQLHADSQMILGFPDSAQRGAVSAPRVVRRIALSLIRRPLRPEAVVDLGPAGRMLVDLNTPFGLGLYRYGIRDPAARLMQALLHPGDIVIDGGANFGMFSLLAAATVGPTGRVIACEPVPGTAARLRLNARLSDFSTIEIHEVALSDVCGTASLVVFSANSALASFAPYDDGDTSIDVELTTLDELPGTTGGLALIKLDIEGAEVKALRGSQRLLRGAPMLLVEVERGHLERQGTSPEDLRVLLEKHGYEAFAITAAARLRRLSGPWEPPDPANPNLLLAPPARADRLVPLTDA